MKHSWKVAPLAVRGTRSLLLVYLPLALSMRHAAAQGASLLVPMSAACVELNKTILTQMANGRLEEAEIALSPALAGSLDSPEQKCAGLVLSNMAEHMSLSGRPSAAERFAGRSIAILEKRFPPDDPVLLRPLHILAAARFEQGKTARAKEAFKRMRSIRILLPADRALVHGTAAALAQAERRRPEAESEYLAAIGAWEEAGLGDTADVGALLTFLGNLYIEGQQLDEARRVLDRALTIFTCAKDAVPMDRIKLLDVRAVLHARQGEWGESEQDLQDALTMVDRESRVEPVILASILTNYAQVLRKNHRRREARPIEARAAALHGYRATDTIIDVTELLAKQTPKR